MVYIFNIIFEWSIHLKQTPWEKCGQNSDYDPHLFVVKPTKLRTSVHTINVISSSIIPFIRHSPLTLPASISLFKIIFVSFLFWIYIFLCCNSLSLIFPRFSTQLSSLQTDNSALKLDCNSFSPFRWQFSTEFDTGIITRVTRAADVLSSM